MSKSPNASTASASHCSTAASSVRSTGWNDTISPPAARTSSTVSSASATFTSQPTTLAPSAANCSAACRPWPPAVPLIAATLPASRPGILPPGAVRELYQALDQVVVRLHNSLCRRIRRELGWQRARHPVLRGDAHRDAPPVVGAHELVQVAPTRLEEVDGPVGARE